MTKEIWCPLEDMKKERLWYSVVVRDRHGKVVSRERRKSHSFLKQWNQLAYVMVSHQNQSMKDAFGTPRTIAPHTNAFWMAAPLGSEYGGIIVGTGNTAVDIEDFQLAAKIGQGVGAGQMEYLEGTTDAYTVAPPSCSFGVHRTIVNNSGGIITVREAGIHMAFSTYAGYGIRDVFVTPQAVPNGGSITIDWTIQVTV